MSEHAKLLQPSKAPIWANCHGMVAATIDLPPEPPSEHAASGTLTHKMGELLCRDEGAGCPEWIYSVGSVHTVEGFKFKIDADRIERAETYANRVLAVGGMQFYECRLSLAWTGVPDQFGSSDAVIALIEQRQLESHDLKDGSRQVLAKDNDQLITYVISAWKEYSYLADFQTFKVAIHQPKINWYDEHTYTKAEIVEHEKRLARAGQRSVEVISLSAPKQAAALNPGPWCEKGWCRVRGSCPARTGKMVAELPDTSVLPTSLTVQQMGDILKRRSDIEGWFSSLAGAALALAMNGTTVPGWKLVQGRAGNRKWKDEEAVGELVYEAIQAEAYTRQLISPAAAEKKLKKHGSTWAVLQEYIEKPPGAPSLVQEADGRGALQLNVPEFQDLTIADKLIGDLK